MTKLHTCKAHDHAHSYVACADCAHQYCPNYWRSCPSCNGAGDGNRFDGTIHTTVSTSTLSAREVMTELFNTSFARRA